MKLLQQMTVTATRSRRIQCSGCQQVNNEHVFKGDRQSNPPQEFYNYAYHIMYVLKSYRLDRLPVRKFHLVIVLMCVHFLNPWRSIMHVMCSISFMWHSLHFLTMASHSNKCMHVEHWGLHQTDSVF